MEEGDCILCTDPLSDQETTTFPHVMNGVCTGFTAHTTCMIDYVHNHLTQGTNLVCLTCRFDLAPQVAPPEEEEEDAEARLAASAARAAARMVAARAARAAAIAAAAPRERGGPFDHLPVRYIDIYYIVVGGRRLANIVMTGGSPRDYLYLGTALVYAYMRNAPYLFRRNVRGGKRTNRKRGGTRKDIRNYVLKPNEVAVITIRDPKESLLRKLEAHIGKPIKTINYDELAERLAGQ